jgi:hypothetical protein
VLIRFWAQLVRQGTYWYFRHGQCGMLRIRRLRTLGAFCDLLLPGNANEILFFGHENSRNIIFRSQKFPKYYFSVSKIPEILFFGLKNSRNILFWSRKFPKYYFLVTKIPEIIFFGLKNSLNIIFWSRKFPK